MRRDAPDLAFLTERPFAHRGLHGKGVPENSLAAFSVALEAGQGMECDVRLSADRRAMVFHDAELRRMTGLEGRLSDCAADRLRAIPLNGTDQHIPSLADLLALIDSAAPLLVEIKSPEHGSPYPLCRAIALDLAKYTGPVAIMSFSPLIVRWFAARAPSTVRGLVVTERGRRGPLDCGKHNLALMIARPHFLAYDIRDIPSPFAAKLRGRGTPVLSWTVRTDDQRRTAETHIDQIIHELPALGGRGIDVANA